MNRSEESRLITSAVINSCKGAQEEELKKLIEKEPGLVNVRDHNGRNLLHFCAEHHNSYCADLLLLRRPILISSQDDDGYTPLHLTAICGNLTMVQFLIKRANELLNTENCKKWLNCFDNENHTAFHWATVCGESECLSLLHEAGADATLADIHGAHPVHYAAQNAARGVSRETGIGILKDILKFAPGESDQIDKDGRSPLLWAASSANCEAILALVNCKADVSIQDKDGLTGN